MFSSSNGSKKPVQQEMVQVERSEYVATSCFDCAYGHIIRAGYMNGQARTVH